MQVCSPFNVAVGVSGGDAAAREDLPVLPECG